MAYVFDLNEPPGLDLNESPPSEPPTPPHPSSPSGPGENRSQIMTRPKTKNLSNDQRYAIYIALLKKSVNGKLKWGTTKTVAEEFSVTMRTVQRIWKRAKQSSNGVVNVSHLKTKNCGRKIVQIDLEQLKSVPLSKRTTVRSTAYAIKVAKSTLFRCFKRGGKIRRHFNPIKPFLTDKNKRNRVEFCLSMLDKNSPSNNPQFINMKNIIHVDPSDKEFCEAASRYGFDIRLMCQPSNSLDLNILDLAFFNAIQSLRYKECPKSLDELI